MFLHCIVYFQVDVYSPTAILVRFPAISQFAVQDLIIFEVIVVTDDLFLSRTCILVDNVKNA